MGDGRGLTIISDQYKGLVEAVKERAPACEHRQCARHIYTNFKKKYTGVEFRKLFWRAAKSTTESAFRSYMREINAMSTHAYDHLMEKDPKTWCKAFFELDRCCDAMENGISESFNAAIVEARKKPIISMLEEVRVYVMERMYKQKGKGENGTWIYVLPLEGGLRNLKNNRGIGMLLQVAYVAVWFTTNMFGSCYRYNVKPTNGADMWPETDEQLPEEVGAEEEVVAEEVGVEEVVVAEEVGVEEQVAAEKVGAEEEVAAEEVGAEEEVVVEEVVEQMVADEQPNEEQAAEHVVAQHVQVVAKKCNRRKGGPSHRITKLKLMRKVVTKDGSGSSIENPVTLI
ncbi:unnamed protein product [Lactuca saligna]|uniref:Uncharacterized protein n=1 Tax=Lactuca saligna TaxID=75948 RepID=A0AA35ZF26_LACSI|nr:unnamed protein product [Lactuca saligna]